MTATLTLPVTLTVTLTVTLLGLGCRGGAVSTAPSSAAVEPIFRDVALASGIDFVHANGATGSFFYPELMQGGAAFLDYDNDRDLDIYLVQSGPLPAPGDSPQAANRLYRNRGDGSFEDATASAGVGDRGYGSGVAVADYDGDGWVDLYVTNLGANHLYRNRGDGSFEDATGRTATGDASYSTSAAFFDYDHDGDLDLYVCNYVDWSTAKERRCLGRNGLQGYCSPSEYRPQADTLYRNDGDGRFTDVSARAGIASVRAAGLGVVTADFDGDGWTDVYVANDQMANLLWMNRGDGTFVDEALLRGAALNGMGRPEAGMGVIVEDGDSDGDWDLFMVHLSGETNTYYENRGGDFRDVTDALGLGAVSQPYTGFGVGLHDFDHDGWRDLFIANGKVSPGDTVEFEYAEPNQLLLGLQGGTFRDAGERGGDALALLEVSRATAFGDYDNDGDVDILVANNGGPARLLQNQAGDRGHWLGVELVTAAGAPALGTIVEVRFDSRTERRQVQPASSYCTSNDPRAHFGLGTVDEVELRVVWPNGAEETRAGVAADQWLRLVAPAEPAAPPLRGGR